MPEILLYDDIGALQSTAKCVVQALAKMKPTDPVHVRISSGGGDFFEGEAIFAALKRHKGRVTCYVDAIAASAASYIAMAADEIVMSAGGHLMIHCPSATMRGNQDQMRGVIEQLEVFERQMARVYAQRSGQDEAKVREWMRSELWLTAEQALQAGFADRIEDSVAIAAAIAGDLTRFGYRHIPVAVAAMVDPDLTPEKLADRKIEAAKPAPTAQQVAEMDAARLRRQRMRRRMALIAEVRPNL